MNGHTNVSLGRPGLLSAHLEAEQDAQLNESLFAFLPPLHLLPTPVTVFSEPPTVGTADIEVPFECPKGKWCTVSAPPHALLHHAASIASPAPCSLPALLARCQAGLIVDCTAGTYNPLEGSDLGTACKPCPDAAWPRAPEVTWATPVLPAAPQMHALKTSSSVCQNATAAGCYV